MGPTDGQKDGSRYRLMPPTAGHNKVENIDGTLVLYNGLRDAPKLSVGLGRFWLHQMYGSVGPPESTPQTAPRSVHPFMQGCNQQTYTVQTDRQTDRNTRTQTTLAFSLIPKRNELSLTTQANID